jgi:tetratricopeptide (TPR) repeat protein
MTLTDRHLDELKQELWRDLAAETERWAGLLESDLQAVVDAAARALRFNDRRGIVAIGEAVIRRGMLASRPLRKTGFFGGMLNILVEEGRYAAALEAMDFFSGDTEPPAKLLVQRAQAQAGLGRLKEARQTLARALELEPQVRNGRALMGSIEAQRELKPRLAAGEGGWRDVRRLADAYIALDLAPHAAKTIREHAPRLPAPAEGDYEDALSLLRAALPLLGPEFVLGQAPALRPVARDDRLKALMAEAHIALKRPDKALGPDEGGRDLRFQRALASAAAGDLDEALVRLGLLSRKFWRDLEIRAVLDYLAGVHVLKQHPLELSQPGGPRRIFNLMPFNDEIALLKMHLEEMTDFVDLFVIVESEVTFTGGRKPLHFAAHRQEFAPWADKIRHVVVPEHPPAFHSPWGRDFRQRDMAITAISGLAAPDDLVLLTDVDEIVDRSALEGFDCDFAGLRMATFRYFLNYRPDADNAPMRPTGAVWKARHLQRFGSSYARFDLARRRNVPKVEDAGWHFTSMCDPERLVAKINSYAHQERKAEWRDLDTVDALLTEIRSGRFEPGWERADIGSLPAYVRDHREELADLLI